MSGCKECGGHWCEPHALQKSTLWPLPFFSSALAQCRASAPNFSSPAPTEVEGGATRHLEVHRAALQMSFLTAVFEERSCSVVWLSRVKRAPLGELLKKKQKNNKHLIGTLFIIHYWFAFTSVIYFDVYSLGSCWPHFSTVAVFVCACLQVNKVSGRKQCQLWLLGGSMQPTCGW